MPPELNIVLQLNIRRTMKSVRKWMSPLFSVLRCVSVVSRTFLQVGPVL